jgi:terminase large subunit-like protein
VSGPLLTLAFEAASVAMCFLILRPALYSSKYLVKVFSEVRNAQATAKVLVTFTLRTSRSPSDPLCDRHAPACLSQHPYPRSSPLRARPLCARRTGADLPRRPSQELFGKVLTFYRDLDRPIPAHAERKLSLELENGSRIVTLPGTDKTIRGFSGAALLIVDEAARVDDELYFAVRPMLAVSGGALMMLSTPAGWRGVFFEEWTSVYTGWERYEVKAQECPRISPKFLEEERQVLPSWVYRQEYECSFEELEDTVFTYEMIQGAVTSEVTPLFGSG